jgi:ubiquitin-conjugating enzyme E2 variant
MTSEFIYNYLVNIILGYLLADFIMGIYHWIKDTYFSPFTPIIGKSLIWGSRLHHIRPRHVIEFSDWNLFSNSAKWTLLWMGPLIYFTGFTTFVISLFLTISLNDVIHKYAHMMDHERPMWATIIQKLYIFQSHDEHHLHHISPHEINYCPITPYINIILEEFSFWKKMESIIECHLRIKARAKEYDFVEDSNYAAGVKFLQ